MELKSGRATNKKEMTIHLAEDALGWVAVSIASIVMLFVHVPVLDPILAIVINLTVMFFAIRKLLQVVKIMLQRVPDNVNLAALRQQILCIDGVKDVNSLHIWSLTREKIVVRVRALKDKIRHVFKPLNTGHSNVDLGV